ncbi:CRISPR-associated Cas2 family protein [Oscillochloris trichoides DG-6]|uniref:CRISPR-associated endoribonuclease Cas2 n=1 Tax=Oscillochloris trichoides DG-6 TaxID=765420 RepID=E1IGC8_9CHLR|nr:CRISPR-associated endonuclease Cas2 [Oscillochloris trichoides]EFO79694.1 CRISPR-associated Cas2 family protein [Oscillochloris trichoides DG-6]
MLYLITYDIAIDKRRTKLAKLLEGHGQRVQYSVFECDLNTKQINQLNRRLKRLLRPDEGDNLRIYQLCSQCRSSISIIGNGPPVEQASDVYII